jgi:RNA polymerase sigma factor (sigma-70 family)
MGKARGWLGQMAPTSPVLTNPFQMTQRFTDDHQLLQALARDDAQAWEHAYKNFRGRILGFLRNRGCNDDEARDIFHESLLVLGQKAATLVLQNTKLSTWLTQVAWNKFLHLLRRRGREVPATPEELGQAEEVQFDPQWLGDLQPDEQLAKVLARLSAKCQELLAERHLLGLKPEEIAKRHGYTDAHNATVQVSRCMDKAKQMARALGWKK